MAMCKYCKTVRRKATTESWIEQMCNTCYGLTEHFTWENRWSFLPENKKLINYKMS